jgi:hypothetical protein
MSQAASLLETDGDGLSSESANSTTSTMGMSHQNTKQLNKTVGEKINDQNR